MKLIKAIVRTERLDEAIRALKQAGAPGLSVSHVHGVGHGYDPAPFALGPKELSRLPRAAKLEVICRDEAADGLVTALREAARTGARGDGIVVVTPIDRAVHIRTGEESKVVTER